MKGKRCSDGYSIGSGGFLLPELGDGGESGKMKRTAEEWDGRGGCPRQGMMGRRRGRQEMGDAEI